jgi:peptidoglycan/LPS O-acetylase OafA/YrhL
MTNPIASGRPATGSLRIAELDGIRGIAILQVLVWHYVVCLIPAGPGSAIRHALAPLRLTWSGVDLFFVLSGFLIGGILIDNREAPHYFKAFYVRRICRIFPLYYGWLLLFLIAVYTLNASNAWLFQHSMPLWSYATFTQNFFMADSMSWGAHWLAITWSLAVEEQFYLLLPIVVYCVSSRALPLALIGLIVMAPILRIIFILAGNGFAAQVLMPCRADALLLGALSAYAIRQPALKRYIGQNTKLLYVLLGAFAAGVGLLSLGNPSDSGVSPQVAWRYSLLAGLYATFLLIAVSEKRGPVTWITRLPWLGRIGLVAYGIYIFHQGLLGLAHQVILQQLPQIRGPADAMVTCGALVVTLVLALLSWKYFEKPILEIGHTFRYREAASRPLPLPSGAEVK